MKSGFHLEKSTVLFSAAVCLAAAFMSFLGCDARTTPADKDEKIVIMCAFGAELDALIARTQVTSTEALCGRTWHLGVLGGKNVVIVASGISEVNAALMAQAAVMRYKPKALIFSGVAGAVDPGMLVSDVVVPQYWAEYQEQVFARMIPGGWDPSAADEPIDFPNFQMMFPLYTRVTTEAGAPDVEQSAFWFQVDPELFNITGRLIGGINLKRCNKEGKCLPHQPVVTIGGWGLTGTTFMDNDNYRIYLWQTFQAEAVDRESAAVAHVAYVNNVPFIAFRAMSDLAGSSPDNREFSEFAELAAENVTTVLIEFLKALPK